MSLVACGVRVSAVEYSLV